MFMVFIIILTNLFDGAGWNWEVPPEGSIQRHETTSRWDSLEEKRGLQWRHNIRKEILVCKPARAFWVWGTLPHVHVPDLSLKFIQPESFDLFFVFLFSLDKWFSVRECSQDIPFEPSHNQRGLLHKEDLWEAVPRSQWMDPTLLDAAMDRGQRPLSQNSVHLQAR